MAQSRFSMPLFAVFLVAIAAYMAYLVVTKNVWSATGSNHSGAAQSLSIDGSEIGVADQEIHNSFFDAKNLKKIISTKAKKIIMAPEKEQGAKAKGSIEGNTPADTQQTNENTTAPSYVAAGVVNVSKPLSPQQAREFEFRALWEKYSATVPKLYSRPLTANLTEEKLARIGQLSVGLDLLYQEDKSLWSVRLEEVRSELIALAVEGEREGARALSFQYVRRPLGKVVEALTWAMIANAIAPNDYYIYLCAEETAFCSESIFSQASEQAKYYSDMYNFIEKR